MLSKQGRDVEELVTQILRERRRCAMRIAIEVTTLLIAFGTFVVTLVALLH